MPTIPQSAGKYDYLSLSPNKGIALNIRQDQIQAFQLSLIERANLRLAQYASERFPAQFSGKSVEERVGLVSKVRERANDHGITTEPDIACVLDLTIMYGPEFYVAEWAADVFAVNDWNGTYKVDVLRERVRRRLPNF